MVELDTYFYTNRGGREHNEDSGGFRQENGHGIYVVADGLGGHLHGEQASECVRDFILESWDARAGQDREKELYGQIVAANQKLLSSQKGRRNSMKSTAVALAIDGEQAVWAHAGDSRLYYFHNRILWTVTEDHSVSYKKYRAGEITRAQIGQDEDQSCLLRVLGSREEFEPAVGGTKEPLEPGDAFLLCTDGAWEYLYDEEMTIDLLKAETAKEWTELLLLRAAERMEPGNDNLTILTVMLSQHLSVL